MKRVLIKIEPKVDLSPNLVQSNQISAKANSKEDHLSQRAVNTARRHAEARERKVVITEKEEKGVDDKN